MDAISGRAGIRLLRQSRQPAAPHAQVAAGQGRKLAPDCTAAPSARARPTLRFQSPAAGVGSEMVVSFRPIPHIAFRIGWIASITEFVWNSHFCDEQLKGPFASWKHCHRIAAESREDVGGPVIHGTLISDEVEYTLPLGPLGALGDSLFVRQQMEATFAYRQQRLEEILPVAARQAARRS